MKKTIKLLVFILFFSSSKLYAEISLQQKAKTLRHNVVSVKAKMTNTSQQGFAWVVGDSNNYLYLVTANHVVDGANPGAKLENITLQFFRDDNTEYSAEVVPGDSEGLDLAILKMKKPNRQPWLYASADLAPLKAGTKVTYVGKNATWYVAKQAGRIKSINVDSDNEYDTLATNLELDVGTSGAPLISANGIVGMVITNSSENVGVISLAKIKGILGSRGLPWGLIPAAKSPLTLGGVWAPKTPNIPDNIRLTFKSSDDYAHYIYEMDFPSSPRDNQGIAVVDGDEVKIWQSMSASKTSYGTFKIYGSQSSDSREGIVMDGLITDGDMQTTQLRLVKLKDGADDPQAIAWMRDNPSDFEQMARKYLPAIKVQNNGGTDEDAFSALGENEQQTIMGGMAQGMMLRSGLMRLAELGLTNVKLAIENNCYTASGRLNLLSQKDQVSTLLKSLANDANNQFGKNYQTCNQTQVADSDARDTNSSAFDFVAELAQPRRLLSGLAPDAKLSIDGECVLLEGKLQSAMHKMMLANMLSDLVESLSNKSKKALKACDQTTI
tara:strand:- start:3431 stop:5089 length:1659 start_codon:yes stop_codon:yes gene_type:complete